MSDLFDDLKRVLDDGLILTPDIQGLVMTFMTADTVLLQEIHDRFWQYCRTAEHFPAFSIALHESANQLYKDPMQADVEVTISVAMWGMALGILAAQRMKTEQPVAQ